MDGQPQTTTAAGESWMAASTARRRIETALLVLACAAALAILFGRQVVSNALWTDELFSLTTAEEPPRQMLRLLASYRAGYFDHPPLYFLLLRTVLLFSDTPLALRLPSLLFGTAAAALVGLFVRRKSTGAVLAFAAAMTYVTTPCIAEGATFVRMYSLVAMIGAALLHSVQRGLEGGRREAAPWLALSAVLMAALVYTSYFALLLAAGTAGVSVVCLAFPRARESALRILATGAAASVLSLGWAHATFQMLGSERGAADAGARTAQALAVLYDAGGRNPLGVAFILAGWAGIIVEERGRGRLCMAFVAAFAIPFTLLAVMSPPDRVIHARYLSFAFPLLHAGAACGLAYLLRKVARRNALLGGIFVLVAAMNLWTNARTGLGKAPDWWRAAETIETQATPREIVLTGASLAGEAIVYHMREPERISFLHYQASLDQFYVAARDPHVVWYVNGTEIPKAYDDILRRYFPWRADIKGDRPFDTILITAKRPFTLPGGGEATYFEPVPLPYEQPSTTP